MENKSVSNVLFCVLNMGLGHATRSLPVIREFIDRKYKLTIGSSGRSLVFLRNEVPEASFLALPDYNLEYSKKGVSLGKLLLKLPTLIRSISREHAAVNKMIRENSIDLVISDHRYGCYSVIVPSFFISHQLNFIAPELFRFLEFLGRWFNWWFYRKFRSVIIPDIQDGKQGLFSGRLSRAGFDKEYLFAGIISSIQKEQGLKENIDVFVPISGPEPQRTVLEEIIRMQVAQIPGKKVVALGLPGSDKIERIDEDLIIYQHVGREKMREIFNRSKLIVSRSGYSTIMEIVELGKKALFIPTPGQTEQEYLAGRLKKLGWFFSVPQSKIDLKNNIKVAMNYTGFPESASTEDAVKNIFRIIAE